MSGFGMPPGASGGGAPPNAQNAPGGGYGAPPTGPGGPMVMPVPQGYTPHHAHQFKMQLQHYQQQQIAMLTQSHASGQISHPQLQQSVHNLNERLRQQFHSYQQTVAQQQQQQQQQQGRFPNQGAMPPPMGGPGGGPMQQREMTAAEKKKAQVEMQKRMAAQQQQQQGQMRPGFTPGTMAPQQQQQMAAARMHAMQQQQQQQQQQNGYPRMMGQPGGQAGQTPQYPGSHLTHQSPGMQPLQHMQPPTPQSHGPASVSNPAQQQFQQQQQQQAYQQQQQQQQQNQQMHMQQQNMHMQQMHMQQQQQQQQMSQAPQMGHDGYNSQPQGQPQSQQQHQPQQQPQAPVQQAPAPVKTEDTRYKDLLREMKGQYLEVLQGMQRRQAQVKGLVQMVNILEGDRMVTYDHLLNLKTSLHRLMIRDCPTFPLMEEIRKVVFKRKEDRERALLMTFAEKDSLAAAAEKAEQRLSEQTVPDPLGVEPWNSVRHLTIRVPEAVRRLTARVGSPSPLEERRRALKRQRNGEMFDEEEVLEKRKKEEDGEETASQVSVDEDISQIPDVFVVKTVFDNRKPWVVPSKARDELRQLSNWNIDDHCLPSCSATPFVIVCVKAQTLLVNPLRITLPRTYPHDPATIQFDRSFPQDSEYGPPLQKLFEKCLGTKSAVRSLTDFVEAYQSACEEYQMYLPKYQVESSPEQEQQTPEMVYASHYAARPAATTPIAHKGMVM